MGDKGDYLDGWSYIRWFRIDSLGIFIVVGRLSRWQWFNEQYKVKAISDALGEKNADAFYIFLAVLIAVLGILIMTRIIG